MAVFTRPITTLKLLLGLVERVGDVDAVVVCHGCPTIDAEVMDSAPNLKLVGELEGDRFAARIDLDAAWERGISHG